MLKLTTKSVLAVLTLCAAPFLLTSANARSPHGSKTMSAKCMSMKNDKMMAHKCAKHKKHAKKHHMNQMHKMKKKV